jgi:hypothetical protein
MIGSNSLDHEFFGHLLLGMKGVPWKHGRQLEAGHAVQDPAGKTYVGGVDTYIEKFAGATGGVLQSPTQKVSAQYLDEAMQWLLQNGPATLTVNASGDWQVSDDFGMRWETVSGNYEVLMAGVQPAQATPTLQSAAGIVEWVAGWYKDSLNAKQKWVFYRFLQKITGSFGIGRRSALPQAVLRRIAAPERSTAE